MHVYIYIYVYACVCMCVCAPTKQTLTPACTHPQKEQQLQSELSQEKNKPGGGSKQRIRNLQALIDEMNADLSKKELQMSGTCVYLWLKCACVPLCVYVSMVK